MMTTRWPGPAWNGDDVDPIGTARQKGVRGQFKIFARKKGQYYVEHPETKKRSWARIEDFYDMSMKKGQRATYTHKKRLQWTKPLIMEFLKLYLIDKKKQTEIAKEMGILITQVHGAVKRYKKGDFDEEARELFREPEPTPEPPVPEPEPEPEPPAPGPTPPPDESQLPEDEEDYSPEGNVDPSGVGNDPACKTVFTLLSSPDDTPPGSSLDRMKRKMVYNGVKTGTKDPYTVYNIGKRTYEEIVSVEEVPKDYMIFSGEYKFKFENIRFSIPLPAPNSILLPGFECIDQGSEQTIGVGIVEDDIGNWYAVLDYGRDIGKVVTLEWRVACPVLSKNYWSDIQGFPASKLPQNGWNKDALAKDIEPLADELIKFIGLEKKGLKTVIERLGKHCANFSCGDIPQGDMVEESFKGQVGACRHRALDFMVVALRLGVNVRYAISDCHAYPELYNPTRKMWVALDLGGCGPEGPRNPDDLNPPEPKKPEVPEEKLPDMPERPEDLSREPDLRDIMKKAGMTDTDIRLAYQAWKKAGGN